MGEDIELRPLPWHETGTLREKFQAACAGVRPGECFCITPHALTENGHGDLIKHMRNVFPCPDFPHAIVWDSVTENFVIARLTSVRDVFELLQNEAIFTAACKSLADATEPKLN